MTTRLETPEAVTKWVEEQGITPRGVQSEAVEAGLLEGTSIMVSSPTGSGKTLIGEMAVLRAISQGRRAMFMVPLRALANQVYNVLRERYARYDISIGISTRDYEQVGEELAEFDVLVTTYERADSLLRHQSSWMTELGTVVIDEVQVLSERGRGARLESVILRLKKLIEDLQLIALSATVGSPDQLADWLECTLIESDYRQVPLLRSVITKNDREQAVLTYTMKTIQHNGQVIVFHRTRKETEAEAERLSSHVVKHLTARERESIRLELESVEHFHVTMPRELHTVLYNGVGYHHAGLGSSARKLVEKLFRTGLVRTVCATPTLSSGMDLPARTVIITSCRSPIDYRELLPANRIHQMLGRAGRPGRDKKGFGIIITESKGQKRVVLSRYFNEVEDDLENESLEPKYDPVRSALTDSGALEEQLLVVLDALGEATIEEVKDYLLTPSLLMHDAVRRTHSAMRLFCLGEITAEAAIEQHALSDTIRASRGGVLGTVELRVKSETIIGGIVSDRGGSKATCRYSTRVNSSGVVEGVQCSCGRPIDRYDILCPHLVALGVYAAQQERELADYVIPLALGETSPERTLVRLGLIEGGSKSESFKPTHLGRLVSRLYLKIPTAREMLAVLPCTEKPEHLMFLVRHLTATESGKILGEEYEKAIGLAMSTGMSVEEISSHTGLSIGDMYSFLQQARWMTYAIMAMADAGGLHKVRDQAQRLFDELDRRFNVRSEVK